MKHGQTHGGKGSVARKVNNEKFADNWDRIFKKDTTAPSVAEITDRIESRQDSKAVG
jgi:hypothetical protein